MSYLVLARKWRPRDFSQVAGQEHVLRALVNALDTDRLHHAFLFSGTRGVGKTTLARIFAKSINCEQGVSSTPCGECSACREVDEGRFVDLIEVDAASRTRVDDTRELLDNVQYAPTRGRYKVYLIDEVHMLSTHSFNALLKTLEEPPPHVKFLLATTDPQKLPVTVLSRCLQFNLKRLAPAVIQEQLVRIAEAEAYDYEVPALRLLAVAADGSMRDALSLLDQAVAHAGGRLDRDAVAAMLGTVERTHVVSLLERLGAGDGPGAMGIIDDLAARGLDADGVLAEMAAMLQQVALAQVVPQALEERVDDADAVSALAASLSAESVQLWYQMALHGRRDLPLAPTPEIALEMTVLRMLAFREADGGDGGTTPGPGGEVGGTHSASVVVESPPQPASSPAPGGAATKGAAPAARASAAAPSAAPQPAPARTPARAPAPAYVEPSGGAPGAGGPHLAHRKDAPAAPGDWPAFIASLESGMLRQLAENCVLSAIEGTVVKLEVDQAREHLLTSRQRDAMTEAVHAFWGPQHRVMFVSTRPSVETAAQRAAREREERRRRALEALRRDPQVQALESVLDARLVEESVRPHEDAGGAGIG